MLENLGRVLVLLMVLIQAFYGIYAYADPAGFATLRGTELASIIDTDWVQIYASRTVFVALVVGYLLYHRYYKALIWAALIGMVMPITDAWLAYSSAASTKVVLKHGMTAVYLLVTAVILFAIARSTSGIASDREDGH